jgi:polar amino acid transport system substrate-binding protein
MNRRRLSVLGAVIAVALVVALAACSTASRSLPTGRAFLPVSVPSTAASTTTSTVPAAEAQCNAQHAETKSLRPLGPLPAPGHMPAGSFMDTIYKRGRLIAGVDQTTLGFGYRDPATGDIQGFDVDLVKEVAKAIFGSADAIEFRAVTSEQRQPAVRSGAVDIVASLMSMTCDRWFGDQPVLFSSEYYAGAQNVLVRSDSPITKVSDLNGKKVCATRTSTSLKQIKDFAPRAIKYSVETRPDCLVALQDGTVDAISTDDTIMWGFQFQDPNTRLLHLDRPDQLHAEPYAMAIAPGHPEFVRFVNAVLERVRTDGTWQRLYHDLVQRFSQRFDPPRVNIPPTATPPAAEYRDEP